MSRKQVSTPLIISLGSNQGDRSANLDLAVQLLEQNFVMKGQSRVYESRAVDYTDQPNFYNQLLEFVLPAMPQENILKIVLNIENKMGRRRGIPKGPRNIDIDLIFAGIMPFKGPDLVLPHPRLFDRSFIVIPLRELPSYPLLCKIYDFPQSFPYEMSLQMIR
ncbi:MAG: 2-amino-4-hydroxy-6-hydroxymethyldihydropteridine diphosphokinase [Bdellovibrionales bacterium]|jgi:2-amino-4-hydroxy-6-hydroxymethyldihydropteridine diphosphokinase|nr:2-amino-4-hydroxy-6-hydroxymethyldihydropteridine diphosphokinase [Bdellovibrionales bacterium]MBT3525326.1 2-amino-4-hydroxy-6-hydroxymethyldihydropteridine diphosphokinase [Bdellovibrionales bacterium]MBT7669821.1 2-amino-4-hydroxy-6-hydroxymethyldihydropteridine diphosphokinase [Bdellovibrionales bacterium]MBT7765554.1 2-amino-4-hydroxy-6-hydroxymethyldihydropteridine diphosphokinase [Bdellovibrionales bacterium]